MALGGVQDLAELLALLGQLVALAVFVVAEAEDEALLLQEFVDLPAGEADLAADVGGGGNRPCQGGSGSCLASLPRLKPGRNAIHFMGRPGWAWSDREWNEGVGRGWRADRPKVAQRRRQ